MLNVQFSISSLRVQRYIACRHIVLVIVSVNIHFRPTPLSSIARRKQIPNFRVIIDEPCQLHVHRVTVT